MGYPVYRMTHIRRGCLLYPRTMRSYPHVVLEQVLDRAPSPQRARPSLSRYNRGVNIWS